ncbi:uncharacterized protein ISCGN_011181 [Ixodes scapularis]
MTKKRVAKTVHWDRFRDVLREDKSEESSFESLLNSALQAATIKTNVEEDAPNPDIFLLNLWAKRLQAVQKYRKRYKTPLGRQAITRATVEAKVYAQKLDSRRWLDYSASLSDKTSITKLWATSRALLGKKKTKGATQTLALKLNKSEEQLARMSGDLFFPQPDLTGCAPPYYQEILAPDHEMDRLFTRGELECALNQGKAGVDPPAPPGPSAPKGRGLPPRTSAPQRKPGESPKQTTSKGQLPAATDEPMDAGPLKVTDAILHSATSPNARIRNGLTRPAEATDTATSTEPYWVPRNDGILPFRADPAAVTCLGQQRDTSRRYAVSALSFVPTHISNVLLTRAFGTGLAAPTVARPIAEPLALKAALRVRHIRPDTALKDTRLREAGVEAVYCLARGAPKGPNIPRAQLNHQGPLFPGHGYATHSQTWVGEPTWLGVRSDATHQAPTKVGAPCVRVWWPTWLGSVVTLLTKHLAPKVQAPPAGLGVRGDATLQTPAFTGAPCGATKFGGKIDVA